MKKRILVVAVLVFVLITAAIVVSALISNASKGKTETLLKVAQQQAELIRVAELGSAKAKGPVAQNLAITTKLSLLTDQKSLTTYIGKQGLKTTPALLAGGKDSKTDTQLTNAEQTNRFDEVFLDIMQRDLAEYQSSLQKAFNETEGKSGKEVLTNAFNNTKLLVNKPAS